MSTITRAFTKEQLIEHIKGRKEFADECAADSTLHPERREYYELTAEALRIALASIEAEPVAFRSKLKSPAAIGSERWDYTDHRQPDAFELENCVIERLYTAPPAPVAVPDAMTPKQASRAYCGEVRGYRDGWNACRAVMLQGADGNSPVIPDGICPCCGRKQLKNRTCSVSGCDGKHVARGFCIKHYAIERKKDPSRRESIRAADKRYRARKSAAPKQEVR
ncbi:hypothetical protein F0325_15270 [Enterobacter ludwigii]|uniref:hypothetical protein n=1 Tax=Enterobacter ludwigii TaxID=299767 RepID=UPI0011EEDF2D|nr:hypothetical protein [Enterobacter ludwigii]KAA0520020.1 hypothetical protein F0325_15270 [Enterobacter ludwigii]